MRSGRTGKITEQKGGEYFSGADTKTSFPRRLKSNIRKKCRHVEGQHNVGCSWGVLESDANLNALQSLSSLCLRVALQLTRPSETYTLIVRVTVPRVLSVRLVRMIFVTSRKSESAFNTPHGLCLNSFHVEGHTQSAIARQTV